MKKVLSWLDRYWHLFLIGGCIGAQALVFLFFGEESYLTVQDNLDLFIAHFQVMNWQDGWFAQGATMPMLGGISRDCLSSEWNLYNILFAILPVFPAYMIGYFLKIFLGMGSFALLAKDIWPETFARYRQIAWRSPPSRCSSSSAAGFISEREGSGTRPCFSIRCCPIFPISASFCWRIWPAPQRFCPSGIKSRAAA